MPMLWWMQEWWFSNSLLWFLCKDCLGSGTTTRISNFRSAPMPALAISCSHWNLIPERSTSSIFDIFDSKPLHFEIFHHIYIQTQCITMSFPASWDHFPAESLKRCIAKASCDPRSAPPAASSCEFHVVWGSHLAYKKPRRSYSKVQHTAIYSESWQSSFMFILARLSFHTQIIFRQISVKEGHTAILRWLAPELDLQGQ